jgi:hypothetical protein
MKKDRGPDAAISSSEGGEVKVPSAIVAPARDKGEESRFLETRTKYFQFTGPLGESSGLPLCFGINKIILIRLVALQQFPAISQPSVNRWFWNLAFVNYRWIRPRFSVLLPPWCLAEAVAKSSEETTQRKAQAAEFKHKIIDRTQLFA